jgi:hypothetical protein
VLEVANTPVPAAVAWDTKAPPVPDCRSLVIQVVVFPEIVDPGVIPGPGGPGTPGGPCGPIGPCTPGGPGDPGGPGGPGGPGDIAYAVAYNGILLNNTLTPPWLTSRYLDTPVGNRAGFKPPDGWPNKTSKPLIESTITPLASTSTV